VAGLLSGLPSTMHALATGRSPLAAARAAGEVVRRPGLPGGVAAHAVLSVLWGAVLGVLLPRRRTVAWGAVGGAAIALLDLTIAAHRYPPIAALPRAGQVADHVAFGALVGAVLSRRDRWHVGLSASHRGRVEPSSRRDAVRGWRGRRRGGATSANRRR